MCIRDRCSVAWETVQAKKTVLSAEIYGYRAEMVYFDCFQTPLLRQEFHTNPGEEHIYSFDTERMVTFAINGKTTVLLMPGDSLHVNLRYEGKQVQAVEMCIRDRCRNGQQWGGFFGKRILHLEKRCV